MITKHFFKILAIFLAMIILGLIGILVVNYFNLGGGDEVQTGNQTEVAK